MSRLSIACFLLSILFLPFVLVLLRFTISECDRKSRMADHHPTFAATKAPESSYPTISTGTGAGCFGPFEQLSQEQQTGPSLEAPPPTSSRASSERGSMSRLSMAFFLLSILLSFHPRLLEVRFRFGYQPMRPSVHGGLRWPDYSLEGSVGTAPTRAADRAIARGPAANQSRSISKLSTVSRCTSPFLLCVSCAKLTSARPECSSAHPSFGAVGIQESLDAYVV